MSTNTRSPASNCTAHRRAGSAKCLPLRSTGWAAILTEVLDDGTSTLSLRAWIDPDSHVHHQLRIGLAAAAPDTFEHCPPPETARCSPLPVHHRRSTMEPEYPPQRRGWRHDGGIRRDHDRIRTGSFPPARWGYLKMDNRRFCYRSLWGLILLRGAANGRFALGGR